MYGCSISTRARRIVTAALATAALILGSLVVAAPASAAPGKGSGVTVPWQFTKAAPAESTGPITNALCQTPTRWTNAVSWNCTVFGGQFIEAWMQCDNQVYYSGLIPEGSWYILGVCPAGTWRVTEGILYY
ncbi:MAG: hypothetical protein ACJ72N_15190 [Labedaea sp.]